MRGVLILCGLLSCAAGFLVAGSIKSDIQIQIVATCTIGAILMFGQAAILGGQRTILRYAKGDLPASPTDKR